MSKISTTVLFELRIRKNGDIVLHSTKSCYEMFRTRLGSPVGSTMRIGSYDFVAVRKNWYTGTPDERGDEACREGFRICQQMLAAYRMAVTFELVFPTPEDYAAWYNGMGRIPTGKDLAILAREKGMYVPYMGFPFVSSLVKAPHFLKKEQMGDPGTLVHKSQFEAAISLSPKRKQIASTEKLQALAAAYARH